MPPESALPEQSLPFELSECVTPSDFEGLLRDKSLLPIQRQQRTAPRPPVHWRWWWSRGSLDSAREQRPRGDLAGSLCDRVPIICEYLFLITLLQIYSSPYYQRRSERVVHARRRTLGGGRSISTSDHRPADILQASCLVKTAASNRLVSDHWAAGSITLVSNSDVHSINSEFNSCESHFNGASPPPIYIQD